MIRLSGGPSKITGGRLDHQLPEPVQHALLELPYALAAQRELGPQLAERLGALAEEPVLEDDALPRAERPLERGDRRAQALVLLVGLDGDIRTQPVLVGEEL